METNFDIAILGGGPAGLTAALYARRYGLKTILIGKDIGGTANFAHKIDNYPGFHGSGKSLMRKFYNQALKNGAEIINEEIINIKRDKSFIITATNRKFYAKAVIIALGTQRRKLNIPGEDKFTGKGVSYCATCDAAFFKNKDVAVIGGGDSACKAALLLSGIANKVYMIHRGKKDKCERMIANKLREKSNIEVMNNTTPFKISGKKVVEELIIIGEGRIPSEKKIKVDGVFIEIGGMPASDIAKILGVHMDNQGHIIADESMKTNISGIFAAGDIVKSTLKQIVVAASQGAIAAKSAHDYMIQ